jgi:hypothetical protein
MNLRFAHSFLNGLVLGFAETTCSTYLCTPQNLEARGPLGTFSNSLRGIEAWKTRISDGGGCLVL